MFKLFKYFRKEKDCISERFGSSEASWFCIPRIVLESMPLFWQEKFVELIDEMHEEFDLDIIDKLQIQVSARNPRTGKYQQIPTFLNDYRHGSIEFLRIKRGNK